MKLKPIIFTGDSFTFGEGLELYDDQYREFVYKKCMKQLALRKEGKAKEFDEIGYWWHKYQDVSENIVPAGKLRYELSYAALVSKHFNTLGFRKNWNGGNNIIAVEFINKCIERYGSDNFSFAIINLTALSRDDGEALKDYFFTEFNIDITENNFLSKLYKLFLDWDIHCDRNSWPEPQSFLKDENTFKKISEGFIDIKTGLKIQKVYKTYESLKNGLHLLQYKHYINLYKKLDIPFYFIEHWNTFDANILKEINDEEITEFIKNKTIPIYKDGEKIDLCEKWETDMYIKTEFPWSLNLHPSKKGHQIIADSIIKFIEEKIL